MAHPVTPRPLSRIDADDPAPLNDRGEALSQVGVGSPDPPGELDWRERLVDLRRRLGLDGRIVVWALAALVAAGAAAWLLRPAPAPLEETLPTASSAPAGGDALAPTPIAPAAGASTTAPLTELVAHAAGAVAHPGVYRLDPAGRVDDLVRAAGGLTPDADGARINLAAPLSDGARVYVPRVGEEAPPPLAGPDVPAGPVGADGSGAGPDGPAALVDLNTADEAELDELPGVGPATAGAIIGYRTEHGGFTSVEELLEVRGIGDAKMAEIGPLVTV